MVDRRKTAMGDDVERLLAAVIGMRPPADIGKKTRGHGAAGVPLGFLEARRGQETVGPRDQFLAMARGERERNRLRWRAASMSASFSLSRRLSSGIEQAFAHASAENTTWRGLPMRRMYSSTSAA